jgi:hypothetical protein
MNLAQAGFAYGMRVIESTAMVIKTQRRTHKRKRINKKWLKKYGYSSKADPDVYVLGGQILGHPETIRQLKSVVDKNAGRGYYGQEKEEG